MKNMKKVYCPFCGSEELINLTTGKEGVLTVAGAVQGVCSCSQCKEEYKFNFYPPYTKSSVGTLLEIIK